MGSNIAHAEGRMFTNDARKSLSDMTQLWNRELLFVVERST